MEYFFEWKKIANFCIFAKIAVFLLRHAKISDLAEFSNLIFIKYLNP